MKRTTVFGAFLFPGFILVLAVVNYMNLSGSEFVRPVLIISLIAIGIIIGVMLRNFFGLIKKGPTGPAAGRTL
ncbi:MAG: hypothetical protein ACOH13_11110 [Flavobacteriales bacterium]